MQDVIDLRPSAPALIQRKSTELDGVVENDGRLTRCRANARLSRDIELHRKRLAVIDRSIDRHDEPDQIHDPRTCAHNGWFRSYIDRYRRRIAGAKHRVTGIVRLDFVCAAF